MNSFQKYKNSKDFKDQLGLILILKIIMYCLHVNSATSNRALKELCNHISTSGQCAFTYGQVLMVQENLVWVMLNALYLVMENLIVIKLLALLLMMIQVRTVNDTFQNFKR